MKKNKMNLGIDVVEIDRIGQMKHKERFLQKVFTAQEQNYIAKKNNRKETIAGLFAAKEAVVKVLGTGIGKVSFQEIEIHHEEGRPYACYRPQNQYFACSISHDGGYAMAVALGRTFRKVDASMEKIPKRRVDSHKGDYGRLGLIGGSVGMTGAIHLATEASLRAGSGISFTIVPDSISEILQIKAAENIVLPWQDHQGALAAGLWEGLLKERAFDALAIGCGMGRKETGPQLLKEILLNFSGPMVIDADALYHLKDQKDLLKKKENVVLTPHPKEFSRMINVPVEKILKDPEKYVRDFTSLYPSVLVLKLHQTLVVQGEKYYKNTTGNPGMATGGSGDVLTGIIGAFLGQGYSPYQAAKWGVYIHGLAGDFALEERGEESLLPRDIIDHISQAILCIKEK